MWNFQRVIFYQRFSGSMGIEHRVKLGYYILYSLSFLDYHPNIRSWKVDRYTSCGYIIFSLGYVISFFNFVIAFSTFLTNKFIL